MPTLILYLLKVNGVLLLFALAYFLILRNLTFHRVNRFYLLGGLLFSSIFPFINLTAFFYSQQKISTEWVHYIPEAGISQIAIPNPWWQFLTILFFTGIGVMLLRFAGQLISLFRLHKRSFPSKDSGNKVRVFHEKVHPFTFWQTIYINPTLHDAANLELIMAHERVHVKQWHTLDILLSQISAIFYWFNPGIWFMKIFIRENLEFLTDEAVLQTGIERKIYQYNVLKVETGIKTFALSNGFNIHGIKRRIRMMNRKRSASYRLAAYFVLAPILLIIVLAFTITKQSPVSVQEASTMEIKNTNIEKAPEHLQDTLPHQKHPSTVPVKVTPTRKPIIVKTPEVVEQTAGEVGTPPINSDEEITSSTIPGNQLEESKSPVVVVTGFKIPLKTASGETAIAELSTALPRIGEGRQIRRVIRINPNKSNTDVPRVIVVEGRQITPDDLEKILKPNQIEEIKFLKTDPGNKTIHITAREVKPINEN